MSQHHGPVIEIASRDFWFKVVEMLQQNWALVDDGPGEGVTVHFLHDGSGVFDRMEFPNRPAAMAALRRNGFSRFADDAAAQAFIVAPTPPFLAVSHPNGPIYSSGRFWT